MTYQSDVVRQKLRAALFRPVERLLYRRVPAILPTSPTYSGGSAFLRPYGDRLHILPNGVDLDPYLDPAPGTSPRPTPSGPATRGRSGSAAAD